MDVKILNQSEVNCHLLTIGFNEEVEFGRLNEPLVGESFSYRSKLSIFGSILPGGSDSLGRSSILGFLGVGLFG